MSHSFLAMACFGMTLICYYGAKKMYSRKKIWWLAPIFFAPIALVAIVMCLDIPLPIYFHYTHYLVAMLAPATIAFALPIYRERQMIKQYPITISFGVIAGLTLGLTSNWALIHLIGFPENLANSMFVRSVSTPFAIVATLNFGGIPELTAMMVVVTGVIGMLISEPLFKWVRINSALGKGVALGASAHGAGAAKATQIGEKEGVVASLTMIFTGVAMVLGAPIFSQFIS